MIPVVLPILGDDITNAVVVCWHHRQGDHVLKDDDLVELVTDKATFHVPAPESGLLKIIHVSEGRQVEIGTVLAEIEQVS
jgi:2-oxoglutarate dehydrogenase E2 component (dihydrolipoamide succinyltransferase)